MRDDFSQKTKDILLKRVRTKCSNPLCRRDTVEAHSEEDKVVNTGIAAHITAASPEGPRYDAYLTPEERKSIRNAIWLCQTCAKLIDSDSPKYAIEILRAWKIVAEAGDEREAAKIVKFSKIEQQMPTLLAEMRKDLAEYPLRREIVIYPKRLSYWGTGNELCYHHEDHEDLDNKMTILCNHQLVQDITSNNVRRFNFSEDFVDYLTQ
ncbi:MAG: hypothetical protein ACYDER_07805 [Ktedonobacteraceae bacterium]